MSLKRGLTRGSCDFCFRRKVKCDRSFRTAKGHAACSQCDLRLTPCTFESDDIRTQRHRSNPLRGSISNAGLGANPPTEIEAQRHASPLNSDTLAPPFSNTATFSSESLLDAGINTSTQSPITSFSLPTSSDIDFELSPESSSYLDSIFLGNCDMAEPTTNWDNMSNLALHPVDELRNNLVLNQNPYYISEVDPGTLDVAIEAYFSFACLALPVLYKDAFMADYKVHQSSPALVFAVACRGCPFTQIADKWTLQQRLASCFREAFFQARNTTSNQETVRLDDLEALALMVNFEYEKPEDTISPLQSQLQNLFLTHDSLVLMILQYRIETSPIVTTGPSVMLSRAAERQTLLFWYVYGWDAFNCLDRNIASRIRDDEIEISRQLNGNGNQSYFDAILGLATIARRMVRTLCGPVVRRKGVKQQDVETLYKHLEEWHTKVCPPELHVRTSCNASCSPCKTLSTQTEMHKFLPLQQGVITFLELHCYMQLEHYVSQYGINEPGSLMGQIVDMRVKYEALQAAHKIVEVAQWIEGLTVNERTFTSITTHALVDLAPGILRDICAGASTWLFLRAKEILYRTAFQAHPTAERPDTEFGNKDATDLPRERVRSLIKSASTLRNVAAMAASHRETRQLVERLDRQLESLKELLGAREVHWSA
ncbi:hypothetical protein HD806DRAFT_524246 [Xylariaceae sp. AK1471]|nr:hypothetical protein HD806DRAFT_524246 [Xylariaceae sp. AK1471]